MRLNHTILQVIPRLDSGGAERSTLEITGAIVRAGGIALVATSGGRLVPDIQKAGGEIIEMPVHSKNPAIIWSNAGKLAQIIKKRRVDLIHGRSRAPAWSALMAARRSGAKFVTTYHGAHKAVGPIKRWYNSSLIRSDCVIANSWFTLEAVGSTYDIPPERLKVIPRGVDLSLFDPARVEKSRIQSLTQSWPGYVEKPGLKILLPARLTAWKGHEIAIEAIAALQSKADTGIGEDLTLVFCGGGQDNSDYENALRARIDEYGVREMVHIVGDCADMPAAYSWADFVIAPSVRPEAFGRVVVEAGAMAKPIAASAHGGALETVVNNETGILIEPGDAMALAGAIQRLGRMSPQDREIMGGNGRARATSLYSAAAMCEATLRVYNDLLSVKD